MSVRRAAVTVTIGLGLWLATVGLALLNVDTRLPTAAIALRGGVPPALGLLGLIDVALGALIIARRPGHRLGWYLFAVGSAAGVIGFAFEYAVFGLRTAPGSAPGASLAADLAATAFVPVALLLVIVPPFLFPNGHLPSAAWRPPLACAIAAVLILTMATALMPGPFLMAPFALNPFGITEAAPTALSLIVIGSGVGGAALIFGVAAVIARYRERAEDERQQIKWFIYAVAATAASDQLLFVAPTSMRSEAAVVAMILAATLVPAAMTIAILRYRLYEIDVLIRRTIVYAVTSVTLAVVFFAGVLAVQAVLRPVTNGNELAVAASTLATLAVFQPVRARVGSIVDRRFYRARYDADRAVDRFVTELAGEVDLAAVRTSLLAAVGETLQPSQASVWLREPS